MWLGVFLASTLFVVECVEWESCRRSTSEVLFGLEREVVVTVVTQCDVGRLWNLDRICERWRGPVSVAVYAEAGGGEEARRAAYRNTARCSRAFVTVAEALSGEQYPVNRLRNLAWDACRSATTHAWFLDADFWPSEDAYDLATRPRHPRPTRRVDDGSPKAQRLKGTAVSRLVTSPGGSSVRLERVGRPRRRVARDGVVLRPRRARHTDVSALERAGLSVSTRQRRPRGRRAADEPRAALRLRLSAAGR